MNPNATAHNARAEAIESRLAALADATEAAIKAARAILAVESNAYIYGDDEGGIVLEWEPGASILCDQGGLYRELGMSDRVQHNLASIVAVVLASRA